jgi:hypothetical protein
LPTAEGSPKLTWPPTQEDLQRLYVEQRLSAAKIAKAYGLKTGNPRSAAFLVTYHLRKYGIDRRDRIEELQKRTDAIVRAWKEKFPKVEGGGPTRPVEAEGREQADDSTLLTAEEGAVIELLRNKDLSIRHIDFEVKVRIRVAMEQLHWTRELSLNDIADLVGNKTSGYSSWLFNQLDLRPRPFEEARLKGVAKHLRIYQRRPFDGTDEDKAYILGLKHGDLSAYVPFGNVTRVSTSTTHPALAELFASLFSPFGHVYNLPRYKKHTKTYEWNLQSILDDSFAFLLEPREKCRDWVREQNETTLAYLAGLVDAEGHIRLYANPRTVGIIVSIWNTDIDLVRFAYNCLDELGYRPMEPYLDKRSGGGSSGFHIERKKDYWRLQLGRFDEAQSLLRRLPLRHREKIERKRLALSVFKGEDYEVIGAKVSSLARSFKEEARQYTRQAELEFLARHQETGNDPDRRASSLSHEEDGTEDHPSTAA